jgi:hypothetical protein
MILSRRLDYRVNASAQAWVSYGTVESMLQKLTLLTAIFHPDVRSSNAASRFSTSQHEADN